MPDRLEARRLVHNPRTNSPSWRWVVSSHCRGRTWSARGRRAGLLSLTVNRRGCLAPALTVCDFLIMIMGQLASFGLPWWPRAGRQTRRSVTPEGVRHSQIGVSPALRVAKRLTGRSGCEDSRSAPFPNFLAARFCVAAARDGMAAIEEIP